jgi:hypothetical protein
MNEPGVCHCVYHQSAHRAGVVKGSSFWHGQTQPVLLCTLSGLTLSKKPQHVIARPSYNGESVLGEYLHLLGKATESAPN